MNSDNHSNPASLPPLSHPESEGNGKHIPATPKKLAKVLGSLIFIAIIMLCLATYMLLFQNAIWVEKNIPTSEFSIDVHEDQEVRIFAKETNQINVVFTTQDAYPRVALNHNLLNLFINNALPQKILASAPANIVNQINENSSLTAMLLNSFFDALKKSQYSCSFEQGTIKDGVCSLPYPNLKMRPFLRLLTLYTAKKLLLFNLVNTPTSSAWAKVYLLKYGKQNAYLTENNGVWSVSLNLENMMRYLTRPSMTSDSDPRATLELKPAFITAPLRDRIEKLRQLSAETPHSDGFYQTPTVAGLSEKIGSSFASGILSLLPTKNKATEDAFINITGTFLKGFELSSSHPQNSHLLESLPKDSALKVNFSFPLPASMNLRELKQLAHTFNNKNLLDPAQVQNNPSHPTETTTPPLAEIAISWTPKKFEHWHSLFSFIGKGIDKLSDTHNDLGFIFYHPSLAISNNPENLPQFVGPQSPSLQRPPMGEEAAEKLRNEGYAAKYIPLTSALLVGSHPAILNALEKSNLNTTNSVDQKNTSQDQETENNSPVVAYANISKLFMLNDADNHTEMTLHDFTVNQGLFFATLRFSQPR